MASYQTRLGTFRSPVVNGSQVVTGVGFRPKALLIWSANTAQTPPEFNDFNYWSAGLTDGTSHMALTSVSFDAQATSDMSQGITTSAIVTSEDTAGTQQHRATLTTFSADGFTLDWTNIFGSEARHYVYLAIGGANVSAKVGSFNSNTATGAQAVTGLGFQPTGVIFMPVQNAVTSEDRLTYPAVGYADGMNQGASYVFSQDGAAVAVTKRYQRTDKCVALGGVTDGSVLAEASLTTLDATGFTLNWSTAPASALRVFYLAFAGIPFQVGSLTQPATSQTQTVTGLGFQPGSVLFQSVNAAASASVQNGNDFSLGGGARALTPRAVWMADTHGADPMTSARYYSESVSYAAGSVNATGPSSTLLATATLQSVNDDGFLLAHVADGTQRELIWAAFGEELSATAFDYDVQIGDETGLNPILDTFRIQETVDAPDTMIADFESTGSPYQRFTVGQSVFVTENGVRIFGGYVTGIRERGFTPNCGDLVVEVQATSYEINAKRRVITTSFSGGSPSSSLIDVLTDLVYDYYYDLGVTLHPDQVTGPDLPYLSFERQRGDAVNQQIAESIGYLQAIDFENRLRMWAPGDISAPDDYDEDVNPELLTGDVEVERQLQNGYANKVILVGEPIVIPDFVDPFTGDGVLDTFPLTYKVGGPYPYFVDGAVAFGVVNYPILATTESIGGELGPQLWAYDPIAQTIRRKAGPVANGVYFEFPYTALFIPDATAEDAGEIAQYGLWEHVEEVNAVTTDASAQELADALLAQKLASKDEIVTLKTRELGFHPGQTINVECPSRELTGNFLITQVDTSSEAGSHILLKSITAAKSQNNNHDWRRVYQQWAGKSSGASDGGTMSTTSQAGAGTGLHATRHEAGGIDPINVEELPASDGDDGDVLTRSGAGSVWAPSTGSGSPAVDADAIILTDAYTSRPAAAYEGRLFLPNNGVYVERDTGAAWAPWGPLFPMTVPVDANYAWINQGGASVVTSQGGIYLSAPASATVNIRLRKKTAPATPYVITACMLLNLTGVSNQSCGLGFRQSSDGKLVLFGIDLSATAISLAVYKFTSATAFSATYVSRGVWGCGTLFIRIADNGSNRICSTSTDGQNFKVIHTVGRTDFMTADEVGFWANDQSNIIDAGVTLLSWKET